MRKVNYDKFPSTKISGTILRGWNDIHTLLMECFKSRKVLAVELYAGVREDEVINELKSLSPTLLINTRDLMKPENEIKEMTERFMTKDVLFGYVTNLSLKDYFDAGKLEVARKQVAANDRVIVVGSGAAMIAQAEATLVYVDMARWEIQQRFRAHEVKALGVDNREDAVSLQYKRGYFNDWRVLDKYKEGLFDKADFWLDTHIANDPRMIDRETFFKGIEETIKTPFRVVPFFDPAPWGGQWMKEVCGLNPEKENYGWCFDCVPEENSLYFEVNGVRFELPSVDLVLLKSRELLGEPVEARFGKDFPIRFDFLDTVGGGNLSVQVHPTTQFIRENFGMYYTQDESYYLLDAKDLFLKILDKEPSSKMYMQGLAGVYQYMDMKSEYEVLMKIITDGASYTSFPSRLLAYNEALKKTEGVAQQQESAPVPVEPAMLVIHVDSFIDGNNNKVIDAGESFAVQFSVENKGQGDAYNIRLRLSEQQGYDEYFDQDSPSYVKNIEPQENILMERWYH